MLLPGLNGNTLARLRIGKNLWRDTDHDYQKQ
jgi:hypothetical protein